MDQQNPKSIAALVHWLIIGLWLACPWEIYLQGLLQEGKFYKFPTALIIFLIDGFPALGCLFYIAINNRLALEKMKQSGTLYKINVLVIGIIFVFVGVPTFLMAAYPR